MLSERTLTHKDKYCVISHGNLKQSNRECDGAFQGLGMGKMRDAGQREQTFSYTMNKFWRPHVQHSDHC